MSTLGRVVRRRIHRMTVRQACALLALTGAILMLASWFSLNGPILVWWPMCVIGAGLFSGGLVNFVFHGRR